MLREYMADLPLVAILRGLRPENAEAVGMTLVDAGFRIIEVPLNSPEPFKSIQILARTLPGDCARRRRHRHRSGGTSTACSIWAAS